MSVFSSSTETYVSAAAMHLVDASATPMKDAVLSAVIENKMMAPTILKSLFNGMGVKVISAHKYAKDTYPLGLPQGETLSGDPISDEELIPYILGETGYANSLLVIDHSYTTYTPVVPIYDFLLNTRDYDGFSNTINAWPADLTFAPIQDNDVTTFPRKVEIQKAVLSADGLNTVLTYDLFVEREYVERTWVDDNVIPETEIVKKWVKDPDPYIESVPIPGGTSGIDWEEDCILAVYHELDSAGEVLSPRYCWVYKLADNLYPELHPDQTLLADEFMPVIPLRHDNVDFTDASIKNDPPDDNNLFSTSKELLRRLKMNFEELGANINENPDIAEIDHAYVMWGIDVQTDFEPPLFYLTEFFDNLYLLQNASETSFLSALFDPAVRDEPTTTYNTNTWGRASGSFAEQGLFLDIRFDYIKSDISLGSIGTGKVGYAEKSIQSYEVTLKRENYNEGAPFEEEYTETRWKLVLKAQVLEGQFKTVTVHNLLLRNYIYGSYAHTTNLEAVYNDPDEHNLVIPIQYNLASKFKLLFRNVLYADSAMLIINSVERVKVKWYEKGFFKFVLVVVAVVIAVWTGGAGSWLVGLAAALGAGVISTLIYLGVTLLISVLIDMAVDWIVTEFGAKIGIIGTIVLTIVAVIASRGTSMSVTMAGFTMTTPQLMLQGASAMISSVNEFLVEEGQKIYEEYTDFTEKLSGLWDELEEVNDLLAVKSDLDPLMFSKPTRLQIVPNESPSHFYTRCLGLADNTMFTVHDEIPNFIDSRLQLKKDVSPDMYAMNTRY